VSDAEFTAIEHRIERFMIALGAAMTLGAAIG
jgi:hypothetical protein